MCRLAESSVGDQGGILWGTTAALLSGYRLDLGLNMREHGGLGKAQMRGSCGSTSLQHLGWTLLEKVRKRDMGKDLGDVRRLRMGFQFVRVCHSGDG